MISKKKYLKSQFSLIMNKVEANYESIDNIIDLIIK